MLPLDQQSIADPLDSNKRRSATLQLLFYEKERHRIAKLARRLWYILGKGSPEWKFWKGEKGTTLFFCVDQISVSLFCSLLHTDGGARVEILACVQWAVLLCNSFSNSYIRKNIRQIMLLRAKGNQEFFLDFFSQESKGDNITTDYTMGNRWLHGNEKSFLQTLFVWSLRIAYVQRQHKPIKGWCNSGVTFRARRIYVRTWVIVVMTGKEINCYCTGITM